MNKLEGEKSSSIDSEAMKYKNIYVCNMIFTEDIAWKDTHYFLFLCSGHKVFKGFTAGGFQKSHW